ncbi:bacteriohemerythrin [Pseudomonadota bacterium]
MSFEFLPADLELSISVIDQDHDRLYSYVDLFDKAVERNDLAALGFIFLELIEYTKFHFAREEAGFAACGYEAAPGHMEEHGALKLTAAQLQIELDEQPESFTPEKLREIHDFLVSWLNDHIAVSDMSYKSTFADAPDAVKTMEAFTMEQFREQ